MQKEINEIYKWLNINKLSINTAKTKFILFRARNKKQLAEINIKINDQSIEQVKCIKFLGVLIDERLTWNGLLHLISIPPPSRTSFYFKITPLENVFSPWKFGPKPPWERCFAPLENTLAPLETNILDFYPFILNPFNHTSATQLIFIPLDTANHLRY